MTTNSIREKIHAAGFKAAGYNVVESVGGAVVIERPRMRRPNSPAAKQGWAELARLRAELDEATSAVLGRRRSARRRFRVEPTVPGYFCWIGA